MGVTCDIYLQPPADRENFRPGDYIDGAVKYKLDKDTAFKEITLSLIGKGKCEWSNGARADDSAVITYTAKEIPVSIQRQLLDTKLDPIIVKTGVYTETFRFLLPTNIPPTFTDKYCSIRYFLEIKFNRPGLLNFNRSFRRDIQVASVVTPRLPDAPVSYKLHKELFSMFSRRKGFINVKATMQKSLLAAGEQICVDFEVQNESNVEVPSIKVTLLENVTYTACSGEKKQSGGVIENYKVDTKCIEPGKIKKLEVVLPTPPDAYSVQNSSVVKRNYYVKALLRLPFGHFDEKLYMPLEIGEKAMAVDEAVVEEEALGYNDNPPSYWEVMAEETNNT